MTYELAVSPASTSDSLRTGGAQYIDKLACDVLSFQFLESQMICIGNSSTMQSGCHVSNSQYVLERFIGNYLNVMHVYPWAPIYEQFAIEFMDRLVAIYNRCGDSRNKVGEWRDDIDAIR
jgi:hypothetical protein